MYTYIFCFASVGSFSTELLLFTGDFLVPKYTLSYENKTNMTLPSTLCDQTANMLILPSSSGELQKHSVYDLPYSDDGRFFTYVNFRQEIKKFKCHLC